MRHSHPSQLSTKLCIIVSHLSTEVGMLAGCWEGTQREYKVQREFQLELSHLDRVTHTLADARPTSREHQLYAGN
jgi:hypothetical protein